MLYPIANLMGLLLSLSIAAAATSTTLPAERAPAAPLDAGESNKTYERTELMEGGEFFHDPRDKRITYFLGPRWLRWRDEKNLRRQGGLLFSADGEKTWKVLSRQFEFEHFFVHPITGLYYSVIEDEWLSTDQAGHLVRSSGNKIVMSDDGRHWFDLTRGSGHLALITGCFLDPDHPKRICLVISTLRPSILQYRDDDYSDWIGIGIAQWQATHPGSDLQ